MNYQQYFKKVYDKKNKYDRKETLKLTTLLSAAGLELYKYPTLPLDALVSITKHTLGLEIYNYARNVDHANTLEKLFLASESLNLDNIFIVLNDTSSTNMSSTGQRDKETLITDRMQALDFIPVPLKVNKQFTYMLIFKHKTKNIYMAVGRTDGNSYLMMEYGGNSYALYTPIINVLMHNIDKVSNVEKEIIKYYIKLASTTSDGWRTRVKGSLVELFRQQTPDSYIIESISKDVDYYKDSFNSMLTENPTRILDKLHEERKSKETSLLNILEQIEEQTKILINAQSNSETLKNYMDYIREHPAIIGIEASNNRKLVLYYKSPLTMYDEDAAESIIDNMGRVSDYGDRYKQLWKDIFLNKKYTIYCFGEMVYDPQEKEIKHVQQRATMEDLKEFNSLYNVHIAAHGCLGTHINNISAAKQSGVPEIYLEAVLAPTRNINFTDGIVVRGFLTLFGQLESYDIPFLQKEDGSYITIKQYLEGGN